MTWVVKFTCRACGRMTQILHGEAYVCSYCGEVSFGKKGK